MSATAGAAGVPSDHAPRPRTVPAPSPEQSS